MHSDLEKILGSLRGEKVVYIPNRGNAGDSFIAHATYQLFDNVGLNYEIGNLSGTYRKAIIVCAGGGNLVRPYPNMADFLRRNLGHWRQLIILPHTIRSYEDIIQRFDSNCYVFCRETPSFDFVHANASKARTFLSHDIALGCDLRDTRRQMARRPYRDIFGRQLFVRNAKRLMRSVRYCAMNVSEPRILNVFRTDVEKTGIELPWANIDLSSAFSADDMLPIASLHATYSMMCFIDKFELVRTNRLHIGILSAMLGKDVEFYDNSYGKNRDVYIHSLRDRFSNVRWQAAPTKER